MGEAMRLDVSGVESDDEDDVVVEASEDLLSQCPTMEVRPRALSHRGKRERP